MGKRQQAYSVDSGAPRKDSHYCAGQRSFTAADQRHRISTELFMVIGRHPACEMSSLGQNIIHCDLESYSSPQ